MKNLFDKIVAVLPGLLIGVLIGVTQTGYLAPYMPILVILTALVFLAKFV